MNEEDYIATRYTQNRGIYGMLRTAPYIPLCYRMWNQSTSKKKSIDLQNEVYRPQEWNLSTSEMESIDLKNGIYRLRIRILSIQTVYLSVSSVGPIADYSHSIVDGGFDEMS